MKKINYEFALLQVIGIILVVSGHLAGNGGITLATNWFPAYSFHMPLFMFISGYFYKYNSQNDIWGFIKGKVKKLIIPYFFWNLVYGIFMTILLSKNIVIFGSKISLKTFFIDSWINGHQFGFNLASWFVLSLFLVQVTYVISRKIFDYINFNNEYIMMGIFLLIGTLAVYLANKGYNIGWNLTAVKVLFFIQFYHLGYLYKTKIEKFDKLNSYVYFLILFVIQFCLIAKYKNLNFTVSWCKDFNTSNILLPFITSVTGILFWLRISAILSRSISNNKIIEYISSNTWTIMMHHLFVFFIINSSFALLSNKFNLLDFDFQAYRENVFYSYMFKDYRFSLVYLIAGVTVPIIVKFYGHKLLNFIKKKKEVRKHYAKINI